MLTRAEISRRYEARNRDVVRDRKRKSEAARVQRDPQFKYRNHLNCTYGAGASEHYHANLHKQSGRCGICRDALMNPNFDHCHKTGKWRGLLCHRCNIWLNALETEAWKKSAKKYLKEWA